MFGGRSVSRRTVSNDLYCLDVETLTWTKVEPAGQGVSWPRARYFHTAERYGTKLVVFGGMSLAAQEEPLDAKGDTSDQDNSNEDDDDDDDDDVPCVLNGLWIFDCVTRTWEQPVSANHLIYQDGNKRADPLEEQDIQDSKSGSSHDVQSLHIPAPRYAHTSVISKGRLLVSGGQDLQNE